MSRNKISPSSPWSTGIELHAHRGGLGTLSIDESDTLTDLNCNTEKDNIPTQVKDRTAGVFNVSWACGISIGIGELFGSERLRMPDLFFFFFF